MKVVVTGSDGYIGTVLCRRLLESHEVRGIDTGFYNQRRLFCDTRAQIAPETLRKDIRCVTPDDFTGADAVVHLAELSNDPLGEHKPEVTYEINYSGSLRVAAAAREAGVSRFVYTSSCSVYGVAQGEVDELSETDPQTAYAECKVLVERDLAELASDDFCPVFLRNATAYGASPSMRFDIVLNNLCGLAWTSGNIAMTSDGSPWRPLVHIEDICTAIDCALTAPAEVVTNQIFNVGSSDSNYQVREIAEIVGETIPGCEVSFGPPSGDNRSYRVSFDKIHDQLPGFRCAWNAERGAQELRDVFQRIRMPPETFACDAFTRLKSLTYLTSTGQVDERFYWTAS